jgi:hypothetical protein
VATNGEFIVAREEFTNGDVWKLGRDTDFVRRFAEFLEIQLQ